MIEFFEIDHTPDIGDNLLFENHFVLLEFSFFLIYQKFVYCLPLGTTVFGVPMVRAAILPLLKHFEDVVAELLLDLKLLHVFLLQLLFVHRGQVSHHHLMPIRSNPIMQNDVVSNELPVPSSILN